MFSFTFTPPYTNLDVCTNPPATRPDRRAIYIFSRPVFSNLGTSKSLCHLLYPTTRSLSPSLRTTPCKSPPAPPPPAAVQSPRVSAAAATLLKRLLKCGIAISGPQRGGPAPLLDTPDPLRLDYIDVYRRAEHPGAGLAKVDTRSHKLEINY